MMLLHLAVTPVALVVVVLGAWRAWKRRSLPAVLVVLLALAVEAGTVVLADADRVLPRDVDPAEVPGTYARGSDELVLAPDGTFLHTRNVGKSIETQRGRWFAHRSSPPYVGVTFVAHEPPCLGSEPRPSAEYRPFCGEGGDHAFVCEHRSRVGLCFPEDHDYFRR